MSKTKSISYQVRGILSSKVRIGLSRKEVKRRNSGKSPYIHSFDTYNTYVSKATAFGEWAKKTYGERDVTQMRRYVKPYLESLTARDLSPFSIRTYAQALAKLYGCESTDFKFDFAPRTRTIIKRSRREVKEFDPKHYRHITGFIDATGLRRHEALAIRRKEIYFRDGVLYVFVRQGKGGKQREVPILVEDEAAVLTARDRVTGDDEKLFRKSEIPTRVPCHAHRARFAAKRYKKLARPIEDVPRSERYVCRKDMKGLVLDKAAMQQVSKLLGHNRIGIIASNYSYQMG